MKKAEIRENGKQSGSYQVFFGRISGGEFILNHVCSSKFYKSIKSAEKAKEKWEA